MESNKSIKTIEKRNSKTREKAEQKLEEARKRHARDAEFYKNGVRISDIMSNMDTTD